MESENNQEREKNIITIINSLNSNSNLSMPSVIEDTTINFNKDKEFTYNNYYSNISNASASYNSYNYIHKADDINKRRIYDAIFGHLEFEEYVWDIIDTVEFQRLRNLKQLGNVHYVFPGATHSRFEHSIGTAHLSNKLISHLIEGETKKERRNYLYNVKSSNMDFNIKAVTLAGLLHDLGHGPFSHLFDRKVIKHLNPNTEWEHEHGSSMLLEYLIDKNNIDINNDLKKLVQSLILGDIKPTLNRDIYYESWIYQIVANKKNSIDVDKFDYLRRDSYHVGLNSCEVDYHRIFDTSKIIDDNLCFNIKNDINLLSLFQTRYKLFKQVYTHKKSIAIDLMIKDALILSNKYFNFTEAIYNPEEYVKLDDGILDTILNFSHNDPLLSQASNLVSRIIHRNIYKYIGEILIPTGFEYLVDKIKIEDILSHNNPKDEFYLNNEDVDLFYYSIDYGNGHRNPFDSILFYKYESPDKSFIYPNRNISLAIPNVFKETYMNLYCKDPKKYERAVEVFDAYKRKLKKEFSNKIAIEVDKSDKCYTTPVKSNKNKDQFISNKRGSAISLDELIKTKFSKIN